MNQNELLKIGRDELKRAKVEDAEIKARLLLQFVLNKSKMQFINSSLEEVPNKKIEEYQEKLKQISMGKPLQYITNTQDFMGLQFYVDENVLIPQPDTEILVEKAIEIIKKQKGDIKVLDLCTGSGAIAISIAKYVQNVHIVASDINKNALEIVQKNAVKNEVQNKIQIIQSDMFSKLKKYKFDIIVSNPPYIETEVIKTLSQEVQKEPIIALDGGADGLKFYKKILENVADYLKPNGYILFEIGYNQGKKIYNLWENSKKNIEIMTKEPIKDLQGNDRIMIFKKGENDVFFK